METADGPVPPEKLCLVDKVQNGGHNVSVGFCKDRGLDVLDRPKGFSVPDNRATGNNPISQVRYEGLLHWSLHSGVDVGVPKGHLSTSLSG